MRSHPYRDRAQVAPVQSGKLMGALQQAMLQLEQASSLAALASLRLLSLFPDSRGPNGRWYRRRHGSNYHVDTICDCTTVLLSGVGVQQGDR